MLYCQQCGAANSDDARFCNQCGGKIAIVGEPGGPLGAADAKPDATMVGHGEPRAKRAQPQPIEPTEPALPKPTTSTPPSPAPPDAPSNLDVSTMSLSAIGVRSRGKAWAVLIGSVLALMALGAGAMWLILAGGERPAPIAENALPTEPEPPIELGEPVPQGAEPAVDFVPGVPEPRPRTGSRSRPSGERATTPRPNGSSDRPTSSGSSSGSGSGSSGGRNTSGGASSNTGSGSGAAASGSTGGANNVGATDTTPSGATGGSGTGSASTGGSSPTQGGASATGSGSGSGSSSGSGRTPDWDAMEQEQPQDMEMDAYAARVRSVIRQYYLPRAQSCFEFASRNNPEVRGTVLIGFQIQADGNVDDSRVERNTTNIESLGACLARQVGSWRLPRPPEAPLAMSMPFSR